jgi:UDP-3-O-[3-hydroxymyristoyl] N-acetylglucosamine deacetylase
MAAFFGTGVDNAIVEVDCPELPIMDGSSIAFVDAIERVGLKEQNAIKKYHFLNTPILIEDGDKFIRAEPSSELLIDCSIEFPATAIGRQSLSFGFDDQAFREVAEARTFCRLADVESMRKRGLALGGSLENAVVVSELGILNPEGLRNPKEFVCHKVLDFMGDLALTGLNIIARFTLEKPGHGLNALLAKQLVKHKDEFLKTGTVPVPKSAGSSRLASAMNVF